MRVLIIIVLALAGCGGGGGEATSAAVPQGPAYGVAVVPSTVHAPADMGVPPLDAHDWYAKDAHRLCAPAVEAFPDRPAPPCEAMHMCANEARLSDEQRVKLLEMIRRTNGCDEP